MPDTQPKSDGRSRLSEEKDARSAREHSMKRSEMLRFSEMLGIQLVFFVFPPHIR